MVRGGELERSSRRGVASGGCVREAHRTSSTNRPRRPFAARICRVGGEECSPALLPDAHVRDILQRDLSAVRPTPTSRVAVHPRARWICCATWTSARTITEPRAPPRSCCANRRARGGGCADGAASDAPCCREGGGEYSELIYRIHADDAYDELTSHIVNVFRRRPPTRPRRRRRRRPTTVTAARATTGERENSALATPRRPARAWSRSARWTRSRRRTRARDERRVLGRGGPREAF